MCYSTGIREPQVMLSVLEVLKLWQKNHTLKKYNYETSNHFCRIQVVISLVDVSVGALNHSTSFEPKLSFFSIAMATILQFNLSSVAIKKKTFAYVHMYNIYHVSGRSKPNCTY